MRSLCPKCESKVVITHGAEKLNTGLHRYYADCSNEDCDVGRLRVLVEVEPLKVADPAPEIPANDSTEKQIA